MAFVSTYFPSFMLMLHVWYFFNKVSGLRGRLPRHRCDRSQHQNGDIVFVHRRRALRYTTVIPHINRQPVRLPPTRASMPIDIASGHVCQWLSLFMNSCPTYIYIFYFGLQSYYPLPLHRRSTLWRCRYSHKSGSLEFRSLYMEFIAIYGNIFGYIRCAQTFYL